MPLDGPDDYDQCMMQTGRFLRRTSTFALAVALILIALSGDGRCAAEFGRITLSSGETIRASVAKEVGDICILRTPDGLRAVHKNSISRIETPSGNTGSSPAAAEGKPAPPKVEEKPASPAPKPKASPRPEDEKEAPAAPSSPETSSFREKADPSIEEARAAGRRVSVEIEISGAIDGKILMPADGYIHSKVSFFLEESKPSFAVLPPSAAGSEKARPKPAPKAKASPRAEYVVRMEAKTEIVDQTFFGQPTVKVIKTRIGFRLIRADGEVIVEAEEVDDEVGDPDNREAGCREAFGKSLEALIAGLRKLKTFGGPTGGSG